METKQYTPEEIAKLAPHYRGKPENFDITKLRQPKRKGGTEHTKTDKPAQTQQQPKPRMETRPAPQFLEANKTPTAQKNNSLLSEAIFGPEVTVVPIEPKQEFQASYSAIPVLANHIFLEYAKDVAQMDRVMIKEEMSYYATALLWLRLIDIKQKYGLKSLTAEENTIHRDTKDDSFNVPQPLHIYLASIGSVIDKMGKTTYLQVPDLPVTVVGGFGGYHSASIDVSTHNAFEEIPSLGVAGDMLMAAATASDEPVPDFHVNVPEGAEISNNLLGKFDTIGIRRPEIRQLLSGYGITPTRFDEYCTGTRFNRKYLRALSDRIGKWETFRIEKLNIPSMTSEGNTVQIIKSQPTDIAVEGTSWLRRDVANTSPEEEPTAVMGAAFAFHFQLFKEPALEGTRYQRNANWCCIQKSPQREDQNAEAEDDAPQPPDQDDLPQTWVDNRNARRELPDVLGIERFRAITMNTLTVMENVVRLMVKTQR